MADLGTAVLTLIGTSIGGAIAAGAGVIQARSQERIEEKRLEHEREAARAAQQAAAEAEQRASEAERQALEREVLVDLGTAVRTALSGGGVTYDRQADVRRLAYRVEDEVLHRLVEAGNFRNGQVLQRAGYLLRTEPAGRTDDGHNIPGVSGIVVT